MPQTIKIVVGSRFHDWLLVERLERPFGLFRCSCGTERKLRIETVRRGRTKSCGCKRVQHLRARNGADRGGAPVQHGLANTPEYDAWKRLRHRCLNPNDASYRRYGGRGITVCERWVTGENGRGAFECFYADMGPRPSADHSIDRVDNDGPYSPQNCRWATRLEQAANRSTSHRVRVGGETLTLTEAARRHGVGVGTLRARLGIGCSPENAVRKVDGRGKNQPRALSAEAQAQVLRDHTPGDRVYGARALAKRYGVHLASIQRLLAAHQRELAA